MPITPRASLLLLALLLVGCAPPARPPTAAPVQPPRTPGSWKTIDDPVFSFRVPPDYQDLKARGQDSSVES